MSEKLKPCPFCGGKARLNHWVENGGYHGYIYCLQCKNRTMLYVSKLKKTMVNQLTEVWNKREEDKNG